MEKILHFIMILAVASCKKDTIETSAVSTPTPVVIKASGGQDKMEPTVPAFVAERKYNPNAGGNSNGNGNYPNNNNPEWQVIEVSQTWNVTWDTSVCGFLIMKWDDVKPATTNMLDSVYISDYGVQPEPIPTTCGGAGVCLTNLFWTKYGMTCAIKAEQQYSIRFGYARYDNVNHICTKYFSEWVHITTGVSIEKCN